jgi:hypothetical protein
MAHAKRLGYQVVGQNAAVFVQSGLTVGLQLKRGNTPSQASCFYETRSGPTAWTRSNPSRAEHCCLIGTIRAVVARRGRFVAP